MKSNSNPNPIRHPSNPFTVSHSRNRTPAVLSTALVLTLLAVGWAEAQVPSPLSFFDFEEPEGIVVRDQGTAANHGEIVDPFNDMMARVATGGIYAEAGEGRRCLQWVEDNAFGYLGYVKIPYHDVLNSPNYTLSTWMRYGGAIPNWGYLFWAGGEVWPEPENDRHLDVWLNPGVNGVDSILHGEDGSQLRATTSEEDSGVGVMDGEWHLVTVTLETNRLYRIYLDGVLAAEAESEVDIIENNGDDLWLGARPNDADADKSVKIVGYLDRVRIWDVALSAAQVSQLFGMEGPEGATATPAPTATVGRLGDSVKIGWEGAGFRVQSRDTLGTGSWADVSASPVPEGQGFSVTLPIEGTARMYRLVK